MTTQNLYQIKETYYYRTRIPVDLRLWFDDRQDIKRSLKTKSLTQARRLLKVWNYKTEEIFTTMRTGILTTEQIRVLANNYMSKTLDDLEQDRTRAELTIEEHEVHLGLLEEHEATTRGALAYNDLNSVTGITKDLIEDNGLGEVNSDEFTAIARELLKRNIEIFKIEHQRLQGNYFNGYDDRVNSTQTSTHSQNPPTTLPVKESPKLSDMIDKFMADLLLIIKIYGLGFPDYFGKIPRFPNTLRLINFGADLFGPKLFQKMLFLSRGGISGRRQYSMSS